MKKLLFALLLTACLLLPATTEARIQDDIGIDKAAHFGLSYVISDQLQRNAGFNPFWGTLTTIAIGAAKEKLIDNHFDGGDFAADCAGALFYVARF